MSVKNKKVIGSNHTSTYMLIKVLNPLVPNCNGYG
jgi:hypothetical protein